MKEGIGDYLSIFSLEGKKVIVTGAGRGIGKAIAIAMAKAGADVSICARTKEDVERVAGEIEGLGRKALPVRADVRIKEDVENLIKRTLDELGDIDILVNNAGGTFWADFMDIGEGGWDAVIRENLKSVFLCTKEAGKYMLDKKRGNIINLSSIAGINPYLPSAPYGAAKAGIINFTKTLAHRWAPYIRVNAIAPGLIETEGIKERMEALPEDKRRERVERVPMKRYGKPEEIASVAVFLASDASSYITGTVIVVSGGFEGPVYF